MVLVGGGGSLCKWVLSGSSLLKFPIGCLGWARVREYIIYRLCCQEYLLRDRSLLGGRCQWGFPEFCFLWWVLDNWFASLPDLSRTLVSEALALAWE